ncbi:4167_t:CDS:2 [Acaulospora colombiana]|uniref:4167_t:CDS:1 n=1 Tax=Acaulospora colombiana TaxID=27376 RepID=A0ACA9K0D1_9GLOM|nr:4167_t:CDS:2 [Acaulospora colombiana]
MLTSNRGQEKKGGGTILVDEDKVQPLPLNIRDFSIVSFVEYLYGIDGKTFVKGFIDLIGNVRSVAAIQKALSLQVFVSLAYRASVVSVAFYFINNSVESRNSGLHQSEGEERVFEAMAYKGEILARINSSSIEKANYIEEQLRKSGLKTAKQNFTVTTSGKVISGVNVFGVLNAPRADGTEALVLSAPWRSKDGVTSKMDGIRSLPFSKVLEITNFLHFVQNIQSTSVE